MKVEILFFILVIIDDKTITNNQTKVVIKGFKNSITIDTFTFDYSWQQVFSHFNQNKCYSLTRTLFPEGDYDREPLKLRQDDRYI